MRYIHYSFTIFERIGQTLAIPGVFLQGRKVILTKFAL